MNQVAYLTLVQTVRLKNINSAVTVCHFLVGDPYNQNAEDGMFQTVKKVVSNHQAENALAMSVRYKRVNSVYTSTQKS